MTRNGPSGVLDAIQEEVEKPEFRLHLPTSLDPSPRVWMSCGTRDAGGSAYEPSARLPLLPWRNPSPDEFRGLLATAFDEQTTVGVFSLLPALVGEVRDAYAFAARSRADVVAAEGVLRALLDAGWSARAVIINGLAEHAPGSAETVTRDRQRGNVLIGLHVDSWSGMPTGDRRQARVRLCLNVGARDRYLFFLRQPVDALPGGGDSAHINETVRQYMASHPAAPVVRVRVGPGEAYIAPTDNLIHDGSTGGNPETDWNFNLFGHFCPPGS